MINSRMGLMRGYAHLQNRLYSVRYRSELDISLSEDVFLAHVPKCAGTSICAALGIRDPGHFNLSDISYNGNKIIFVWRDPVDRLVSAYNYARKSNHQTIKSPLWIINSFDSFDSFVMSDWFDNYVRDLYFFLPSRSYLPVNWMCGDKIIPLNFMTLNEDFEQQFGIPLGNKNISPKVDSVSVDGSTIDKITQIYSDDYILKNELFCD